MALPSPGASRAEDRGVGGYRARLLAGLAGSVAEIGAGDGLNFPHYPEAVERIVVVEPEPSMRGAAAVAAAAGHRVEIVAATAEALPLADGELDAGVASLVLCSVDDLSVAVGELFRVIRSGGELRFFEHVVSSRRGVASAQRAADALVWPRISGGCHLGRDTTAAITSSGFEIIDLERFKFSPRALEPAKTFILGCARRP
jgi:ubiquinone/menaquinone biosynthesis C-methylase UbiE